MARTITPVPAGSRITDYISLGVIAPALCMRSSYREMKKRVGACTEAVRCILMARRGPKLEITDHFLAR